MSENHKYKKGRGAQINTANRFSALSFEREHKEGIDEWEDLSAKTEYHTEHPKKIINKVTSPDIGMEFSANAYQGCEHGCIYCYARNAHQYWGYSAGIDFERKIIVKHNAPDLLRKELNSKRWKPAPVVLSGNTDCYQPSERKFELTRNMLKIFLEFGNPVSIITKNTLILRDLDILSELAKKDLVHVMISITTLNESLRQKMEPRTVTGKVRLKVINKLTNAGVPVGVMTAPIIPGLNDHEIPLIIKKASENGAHKAGYTIVRLNGAIGDIFKDWLFKNFPDRAEKVWKQISACHEGNVNDSRWGKRMSGDGIMAETIRRLFCIAVRKHLSNTPEFNFNLSCFKKNIHNQLNLFD